MVNGMHDGSVFMAANGFTPYTYTYIERPDIMDRYNGIEFTSMSSPGVYGTELSSNMFTSHHIK